MAPRELVHVEIPAANRTQAAEFYRKALGLASKLDAQFDYLSLLLTETSGGALLPLSESVHAGQVVVYFSSDDLDADLRNVQANGGKVLTPPTPIGDEGSYAIFEDPTGNPIGLWQSARP